MERPLVFTAKEENNPELQKLIEIYNETLGFCPNSVDDDIAGKHLY